MENNQDTKFNDQNGIVYISGDLFNVWLNGSYLDSHIYFCI